MRLSFAPLEGLTAEPYRRVHAAVFGGADDYYTPFYAPSAIGLAKKDLDRILAETSGKNSPPTVVQFLANRVPDFCKAAMQLAERGINEVNLNLGCPSGTVTGKGRGSGFLAKPDELDRFFDGVFSYFATHAPHFRLTVKTRIGFSDEDEAVGLSELYNRYPIAELIIHPRLRSDMYRGKPRMAAYRYMAEHAKMPVCYNGDIFTVEDYRRVTEELPGLAHIMIGRGAVANPALFLACKGEDVGDFKARLRLMHDRLVEENLVALGSPHFTVCRMADLWAYMVYLFFDTPHPFVRDIHHCATVGEYKSRIATLFREHPLREDARYIPPQKRA